MDIDWNAFTPWSALAGGALIGLAAAMFALLAGRIFPRNHQLLPGIGAAEQ